MPPVREWRSAAAYEYLKDLDPTELAWEFLRRNPAYRRDYRTTVDGTVGQPENSVTVIWRWGLRFRDRSGSSSR
jgi:hypothetical protein